MPSTDDPIQPTIKLWPERLDDAAQRGYTNAEDRVRAGHWATCAVGELYPGGVNDLYVLRLGKKFYVHIRQARSIDSEQLLQFNIPLSNPVLRYHIWRAKRIYKRLTDYRSKLLVAVHRSRVLGENNG